jgi:predicted DNA-binding protein
MIRTMKPKKVPVMIKMEVELIKRLDGAGRRMGSNRAAVVRLAILQLLPQIEAGHLNLAVRQDETVAA